MGTGLRDHGVHLAAGYDSDTNRTELTARNLHTRIAHKGVTEAALSSNLG